MVARTRNLERTRALILQAAFEEIFRRGFQGVSVNDIVERTNLTKGAFFHHFPTKQALGYALVDETIRELTLSRWVRPLSAYRNPAQGILRQLKKIIDQTTPEQLALGCPLNNLIQEMSPVDPVFHAKLQAVLLEWIGAIEERLRYAQQQGFLRAGVRARAAAEFVVMAHEGSFGIAKGLGDKQVFYSLYESLRLYFKAITPS